MDSYLHDHPFFFKNSLKNIFGVNSFPQYIIKVLPKEKKKTKFQNGNKLGYDI
jgi:hypothetical protein